MIFQLLSSTTLFTFWVAFFIDVQAQEFRPDVVPLSVKSPYLNSWLKVPPSESEEPQNIFAWPQPWTMGRVSPNFRAMSHGETQILFSRSAKQDLCALMVFLMDGWGSGKPICFLRA
jgi:hypothetical protein